MTGIQWLRSLIAGLLFVLVGVSHAWAQSGLPVLVNQGTDFQWTIFPVERSSSAEQFYNYSAIDYQSRTFLEVPRQSSLLFYRDLTTQKLALVIIHNAPNAGPGGQASLDFQGIPSGAQVTLKDDPNDAYSFNPPAAHFDWTWTTGHTDGVVINDLPDSGTITITPSFSSGISRWYLLTQKTSTSPVERVPLVSMGAPIIIQIGKTAENYSPLKGGQPPVVTPGAITAEFDCNSFGTLYALVPSRFDASHSQATTPKYEWDFDGDGKYDVSSDSPITIYAFPHSGSYNVALLVTDSTGRTSTKTCALDVLENQSTAVRSISTPEVKPDSIFRVTLDIKVQVASNGLGVEEFLPKGWTPEPVMNDGGVFKYSPDSGQTQWVFPTLLKTGETRRIIYDVRVPSADKLQPPSLPATFMITGHIESVSPAYDLPTLGEDHVQAVSCLSMPVIFSHIDPVTDEVDLRGSEIISQEQAARAITFWQSEDPVPCACNNSITTPELDHVIRHYLLKLPVDQALPEPTSDQNFQAESVTRTIITPLPSMQVYVGSEAEGGNVFQVELKVTALKDLTGLIVTEKFYEGWKVQPLSLNGAVYKTKTREFYFPMLIPAGKSQKIVYQVTVPTDGPTGAMFLMGSSDSWLTTFVSPIKGDNHVVLTQCLSLPLAFAKIDTGTRKINLKLDNLITREQESLAFQYWLEDDPVPGTCGQKLDLETLKHITAYMVTQMPVVK